ncbi:MAG: helix-turn-helix domain-containing protein [Actinomycetota bacterium]
MGNSLREARVRQGIDYPTAEAGTRIRTRYLKAMEDEQFDLLPDPSYVRGFLRAYSTYLDIDPQLVLDEYDSRFGDIGQSVEDARRARRRAEGRPRRREAQLLWLAIGGVTGIALLAWLGIGGTTSSTPTEPVPGLPTTTTATSTTPAEGIDVTFTGRGNRGSYLEVRNGSDAGATLYSGVLVPGATRAFSFRDSAWVRIGKPDAMSITVNGEPLEITGGTGTFLITQAGAERLPAG